MYKRMQLLEGRRDPASNQETSRSSKGGERETRGLSCVNHNFPFSEPLMQQSTKNPKCPEGSRMFSQGPPWLRTWRFWLILWYVRNPYLHILWSNARKCISSFFKYNKHLIIDLIQCLKLTNVFKTDVTFAAGILAPAVKLCQWISPSLLVNQPVPRALIFNWTCLYLYV